MIAERNGLAIFTTGFDPGDEWLVGRVRALAAVWGGPTCLVTTRSVDRFISAEVLPDPLRIVQAAGEIELALQDEDDTPQARHALGRLWAAACEPSPIERVYVLHARRDAGLLPAIADTVHPARIDVELLPEAHMPDAEVMWPWADSLVVFDQARLYGLATGTPGMPVRVVPGGGGEDARRALGELPGFGGAPRVSIVMPVRTLPELAVRTVESVLANTPELLEVILVEDGSPDHTRAVLEKLPAKDARVRLLVHDERRGFGVTCNRGTAAARGDVVIWLNADTVVPPRWSSRLIDHFGIERCGAVGPMSNRVSWPQKLEGVGYDERTLGGLTAFCDRLHASQRGRATPVVHLTGLCLAADRRSLRRVGGFDPRYYPGNYEDNDWCVRLLGTGLIPYRADDCFIHHEGSKSYELEGREVYVDYLELNWNRFKQKWGLPAHLRRTDQFEPTAICPRTYDRSKCFVAPWLATEPIVTP